MQDTTKQTVLFPELFSKPIHVAFCREELSSNGGTVLLAARDRQLKLTESLSEVLADTRQPGKVHHQYLEQMRQRVYGIALGCPDGNDAAKLRNDPMLKLGCDRDPHKGEALASQPSLSRFDNLPSRTQLLRMAYRLAETVISTQAAKRTAKKRPRRIIIDIDPTCDPTHGAQQMTFFNGFYRTWCYLPLVVTVSFDGERRKYPVAVLLRSGNSGPQAGAITVLKRLLPMLRRDFPRTQIYFRADAGFASHQIFNFLDAEGLRYAVSMGANSRLKQLSSDWMQIVRHMVGEHGKKVTIHRETTYKAKRWNKPHRLAYKAEVVVEEGKSPRDNARYVVASMPANYGAKGLFDFYYGHSDMENTIKELKNDLDMDRTSCCRFEANQFRVLMTLCSYVLLQSVQEHSEDLGLLKAQMATLRDRLLKIAVRVYSSVRRIVLEFTAHHPWSQQWLQCARALSTAGP
jgi:hypothetical protein